MNLANKLVQDGHKVTIWSSDFYHQEKRHRRGEYTEIVTSDNLEIRLVPSMGYSRNIGIKRLVDHAQLAFNLRKALLNASDVPDVAFIGYPPIEFAWYAIKFLRQRGVPTLLDIKDNWPEFFVTPFPQRVKWLARLALFPYFILGKDVMRSADGICSMTPSFLNWARSFSGRNPDSLDGVFPLSPPEPLDSPSDIENARLWWSEKGVQPNATTKFLFVGSFSKAFDFDTIAQAADRSARKGHDWQFILCGDGGDAESIRRLFYGMSNVVMPGWVNRAQIDAVAQLAVGGLAPYKNTDNFINNMPNKVVDYLSLSLPIITPLRGEVSSMISSNSSGLLYREGDVGDLYDKLYWLATDQSAQAMMATNARKAYDSLFQHDKVYGDLVAHLVRMADGGHGQH